MDLGTAITLFLALLGGLFTWANKNIEHYKKHTNNIIASLFASAKLWVVLYLGDHFNVNSLMAAIYKREPYQPPTTDIDYFLLLYIPATCMTILIIIAGIGRFTESLNKAK